jgi:hypothetical protein
VVFCASFLLTCIFKKKYLQEKTDERCSAAFFKQKTVIKAEQQLQVHPSYEQVDRNAVVVHFGCRISVIPPYAPVRDLVINWGR